MRELTMETASATVLLTGSKRSQVSVILVLAAAVCPPQSSTLPLLGPLDSRVAVCPPLAGESTGAPAGTAQVLAIGLQTSILLRGVPLLKPPAMSMRPSDMSVAVWEDLGWASVLPQASILLVTMLYICALSATMGVLPAPETPPAMKMLPSGSRVVEWLCLSTICAPASGNRIASASRDKERTFLKFIIARV